MGLEFIYFPLRPTCKLTFPQCILWWYVAYAFIRAAASYRGFMYSQPEVIHSPSQCCRCVANQWRTEPVRLSGKRSIRFAQNTGLLEYKLGNQIFFCCFFDPAQICARQHGCEFDHLSDAGPNGRCHRESRERRGGDCVRRDDPGGRAQIWGD